MLVDLLVNEVVPGNELAQCAEMVEVGPTETEDEELRKVVGHICNEVM